MTSPFQYASNFLGTSVPSNPGGNGVGAARPGDQYALQPVPGTNFAYDPLSGQYYDTSYTNSLGQTVNTGATTPIVSPNLSNQNAGATALQQLYIQRQQNALDAMSRTRSGMDALAQDYTRSLAPGAPSVAGTQLTTGMGQIAADQASQAAGANGQNAFAARRIAAQNTARAQGQLSGQQALARVAEQQAARSGLASLYTGENQADVAQLGTASQSGLGYGSLAEKAESDKVNANANAAAANAKANASSAQGVGAALSALF